MPVVAVFLFFKRSRDFFHQCCFTCTTRAMYHHQQLSWFLSRKVRIKMTANYVVCLTLLHV
jgi:hypothetical protein